MDSIHDAAIAGSVEYSRPTCLANYGAAYNELTTAADATSW